MASSLRKPGNHYVIENADWTATIAAAQRQSINFGFNADWGSLLTAPSKYVLKRRRNPWSVTWQAGAAGDDARRSDGC